MRKWRKILLYVVILFTALKVWFPSNISVSAKDLAQLAHSISNLLDEKPSKSSNNHIQKGLFEGLVISVHDGDTIRVRDTNGLVHKIRLSNIDAPETKQAYGISSRDALRKRIEGKKVVVDIVNIDQYQRGVGQINLGKEDINLWLVRQGHAWHYESIAKKQQNRQAFAQYQRAQLSAQKRKLGLWNWPDPIAPWTFRRQAKNR